MLKLELVSSLNDQFLKCSTFYKQKLEQLKEEQYRKESIVLFASFRGKPAECNKTTCPRRPKAF